jgi:hypothetical protein
MKPLSNPDPRSLYDVKEFSDVKLTITGICETIHAHRVILAAGSEYFRSEFLPSKRGVRSNID